MKYDIRERGLSCIIYKFERKRDYGKNRIYSDRTTRTAHRGRRTRIKKENCDIIYRERYNVEGKTKELKKLMDNLNDRDEVIFLSMANAFKGVRQLCLFLNISRIKNLRIIFLRDRIDSYGEKYESSTENLLYAISTLTEDSYAIRKIRILSEKEKGAEAKPGSFATRNAWSCTKRAFRQMR